ncbi:EAL domain-containing protein [Herbaspirillum sp. RV1423]|uniref:sensor domain-containing protein n=1 Tax=Herbaspirillum sp. RV1423 TaxID=1443993 RepID=UPI0004B6031D|nr:EAL domain-containing protein [Herbaspirillum sp. RV1423]
MKNHLCERISAARTYGCMQHRRPPRFPAPKSPPSSPDNGSDDRFAAVIQSCDDAIIVKTLTGIVTSWNKGAEHIFGYTEKEMIGQSTLRLFPIARIDEEYYVIERILNGEQVPHFNTVRIRKDGTPVDVSAAISPVRDKDGGIVGASIIARDITEQVGLESDAQQFRALLDCSDDAIITETLDGRICSWNGAARAIFGYSAEETVGQPMLRLLPEERVDEEAFILGNIMAGEKIDHFETVRIRKDREPIHVSTTVLPIRDRLGNIVGASHILRDITPLRRQQEQLEHIAHFDSLTDLPNRMLLTDRLHQAIAMSKRTGRQLVVLYLDLDGFKRINDIHGHVVGDTLLGDISRRIAASLRAADTLARIGGDEFAAVLVDIDSDKKLTCVLDRILKSCAAPVYVDDKRLEVSASIGVTVYPHDDVDEDQLMRHANLAMYEAKQAGKNRYHMFDAFREAEGKSRHTYVRRLAEALQNSELVLHYQPKVNMKTGAVIGVEALIRWQHPEQGLLSPAQFLPLIEGHHLNEEIGIWVIGRALQQMEEWRQLGMRMPVSVNLAPHQLQDKNFPSILAGLLARYPEIAPSDLELEILETSALQDIEAVSCVMQSCRKLGVQFSIDDFGTGYSSLTYLKRLPANTLKIDQSFIRDMLTDREDLAIVRGVIGLAKAFRRKVIAEGVETVEHGKRLLQLGCELAQGYGISHPFPADALSGWLSSWSTRADWK